MKNAPTEVESVSVVVTDAAVELAEAGSVWSDLYHYAWFLSFGTSWWTSV